MLGSSILLGARLRRDRLSDQLSCARAGYRGRHRHRRLAAFVVLYDMALLGLLVVDQGRIISTSMLNALLLFNPTDVYRMLNLAGTTTSARSPAWPASQRDDVGRGRARRRPAALDPLPLSLAALAFSRREL